MKKLIFIISFGISSIAFSQTVKVENGKAVETAPEVKTVLTKEQLLQKRTQLTLDIARAQSRVEQDQKELSDLKAKLSEVKTACDKLGYK